MLTNLDVLQYELDPARQHLDGRVLGGQLVSGPAGSTLVPGHDTGYVVQTYPSYMIIYGR